MEHIDQNITCLSNLGIFYKVLFFSENLLQYCKQSNTKYLLLLEKFEKVAQEYIRHSQNEVRNNYLNQTLKNPTTFCNSSDFNTQLSLHIHQNYPHLYKFDREKTNHSPTRDISSAVSKLSDKFSFNNDKPSNSELTIITENNDNRITSHK